MVDRLHDSIRHLDAKVAERTAELVRKKIDDTIFPRVAGDDKTTRVMAQVHDNLGIMVSESERLTLLINDVLDSAKLEAGKVEWQNTPLEPARLLQRAKTVSAPRAEQKGLALDIQAAAELPTITGDENRLLQVLINLISNAVKFTQRRRHPPWSAT